jgi:hypothetical protein
MRQASLVLLFMQDKGDDADKDALVVRRRYADESRLLTVYSLPYSFMSYAFTAP